MEKAIMWLQGDLKGCKVENKGYKVGICLVPKV